jgi:hypothetical protein
MNPRVLFLALLLISALSTCFAGDKPDFSGEWTFNESKSTLDENGTMFLQTAMVVTQAGNDLTIQKTFPDPNGDNFVMEDKLTLDGKECKSEFFNSPRTATANWSAKGDTLLIVTKIVFDQEGTKSEMTINEAWSLKDAGKGLAIKHFSSSSWGQRKITMVFDKKEAVQNVIKVETK